MPTTDTEKNWGSEPWREPALGKDDVMVRSECGRIVFNIDSFNIDYRSHWFVLVKTQSVGHALLVKHGVEERIELSQCNDKQIARIIVSLNSNDAYLLMHAIYEVHKRAELKTSQTYHKAFADGTLKKRRFPSKGITKVWIEPARPRW